jgi:hypothetical protein
MTKQEREHRIQILNDRLNLYYAREKEMLSDGVQSYGLGTRSATRYQTDLSAIQSAIKELEKEIYSLKTSSPRKAIGIVPRDW